MMQHRTTVQRDVTAEFKVSNLFFLTEICPLCLHMAAKWWGKKDGKWCHTGALLEDCIVFADTIPVGEQRYRWQDLI